MLTIIAIAGAAIAAITTYNRKKAVDPHGTEVAVYNVRQGTSVVLAVGNAIWAVLDALMFLTRTFGSTSGPQQAPPRANSFRFGQPAADVEDEG